MKIGFLQDFKGDNSSKRLIATGCFIVAVLIAIFTLISKQEIAVDLVVSFLFASVSLLIGGTAAEQISNFSNKKLKKNEYELE